MSKSDLRIDWATHAAAKYACENWHYSKSIPMPPVVKVGVWECGKFIGAVLFSRGASPHLGTAYSLDQVECCELTRVALARHRSSVSRIIAIAIKFLKNNSPGVRLIVSFADQNEGHHGGIYQAGNWIYSGVTGTKFDYIGPDGKKYRDRQVTSSGVAKQFGKITKVFKTSECKPLLLKGKHRYLMPLDDEMRKQIEPLRKPYPKRVRSIDGDATASQAVEGGSTPTRTL